MTEEEIKQNVGKVLEEYPKKVTTSESDMKNLVKYWKSYIKTNKRIENDI